MSFSVSTSKVIGFLLIFLFSDLSWASEQVESILSDAEESFLDVEYEDALAALDQAESLGGATDEQLERIIAFRATIHYLRGDIHQARMDYLQLLERNPYFELPLSHPPRAREFLDTIRRERGVQVTIEHDPPAPIVEGASFNIFARVRGLQSGQAVWLYLQRPGDQSYSPAPMSRGGDGDFFVGTVDPVRALDGREAVLRYFILVQDGEQRVANFATPRNPLTVVIQTAGRERTPIVRRWWFWTIMGGLVAAGLGFGLYFGLRDDDVPTGDLDITLRFETVE